jgi:FkbM family methyltransferase
MIQSSLFQGLVRLKNIGFAPSGILDIGAWVGEFSRGARQIFPEAHILMVEALPENGEILARVCRKLGNAEYVTSLVGDTEMKATSFFVVDTDKYPDLVKTGSSKYKDNLGCPQEEHSIPQRTLASIVTGNGFQYQLMKLDVQGAELDVIKGLGDHLSIVEVILMEMSLVQYNEGAPLMDAVLSKMRQLGFVLYDIVEEHRFEGGHLFQIDGIFVRPDSRYRLKPPFIRWAATTPSRRSQWRRSLRHLRHVVRDRIKPEHSR